jgi:NitT/TauT family transport system substrate-binding protein
VTTTQFTIGVATPAGMGPTYAYLAPAIALGYDRAEGLEVGFFYGDEPAATARGLCAGACDVACLNTIVGFIGRRDGLPMVAVGSKARHAHRYFAVLPGSPIEALSELRGRRIACDFPHLHPLAEAALLEVGVAPGEFRWAEWHGSGMTARQMVEPLRRGEVDAAFIMDWNDGDFVAEGLPLRHLPSTLLDRIRVSSCYWAAEAAFAADPDRLARGLRAIQKSLVFSFANPEAALRLMRERFPESRPAAGDERRQFEILKACLAPMRLADAGPDLRWCAFPPEEMRAWQDFLRRSGIIGAEFDVARCYTTALVERINDFDAAAVRADAARFA